MKRPLALHSSFPAERHACPLHSLYNIYPTDSDVTAIDRPEPLTHKPVLMTAADYFAVLEVQKPSTPFPKHDGEPGRKPGKSHKGYVLADVLAWPMEVYKEVQSTIHKLSKEELPVATLAQQKVDDLEAFYKKVYEIYPYLQNYANNWAVADFLLVHLKNRIQATKKSK